MWILISYLELTIGQVIDLLEHGRNVDLAIKFLKIAKKHIREAVDEIHEAEKQ